MSTSYDMTADYYEAVADKAWELTGEMGSADAIDLAFGLVEPPSNINGALNPDPAERRIVAALVLAATTRGMAPDAPAPIPATAPLGQLDAERSAVDALMALGSSELEAYRIARQALARARGGEAA